MTKTYNNNDKNQLFEMESQISSYKLSLVLTLKVEQSPLARGRNFPIPFPANGSAIPML